MRRLSAVLLVAVAVAGCKKSEPPAAAPVAAPGPAAPEAQAAPPTTTLKGKVLERLDAPPYSYLKLQAGKDEVWAAVPKAEVNKGAEVAVMNALPMANFESKTLKRKFEVVYFGTLEGSAPPAPAPGAGMPGADPAAMAEQHARAAQGPANVGDVKVPRATGADARTVAEVHAQRTALKEKSVTVRGKVVKFNPGIMGKNWIHIQDGTGKPNADADKADNDLTVTTQDVTAVGDTVVVKGTVRVDKDFGAGYAYKVVVEEAKLSK